MKQIVLYLIVFTFFSCSNIKKAERLADKGSVQDCYGVVVYYSAHASYIPVTKQQEQKIIKYSTKGLALDPDFSERYFFYKQLAYYANDRDLSYAYYKRAAILEDGEAQWIVGLYYLEGQPKELNKDSAVYWLKKAATGNYYRYAALATAELGNIYSKGKDIAKDSILSMYYYKKACACFGIFSYKPSCDKVISFYENHPSLIDTTDLSIYKELSRQLGEKNSTR